MKQYTISTVDENMNFLRFLHKVLPLAGTGFLYKMLRKKNLTLNGRKANGRESLHKGDTVQIWFSDETFQKFAHSAPQQEIRGKNLTGPLSLFKKWILYEDEHILLVNKPAGLLTQRDYSGSISLNDFLLSWCKKQHALTRPSVCNRLDRNTSGLVICGKSTIGLQTMNRVLRDRSLDKRYLALVVGRPPASGSFRSFMRKNHQWNRAELFHEKIPEAVPLETAFETLSSCTWKEERVSLVLLHLISGKTHQIRAQFAFEGFPLLGDPKYFSKASRALSRDLNLKCQCLHSYQIHFPGIPGPLSYLSGKNFTAPVPEKMEKLLHVFHFSY